MDFRILGRLRVEAQGVPVPVPPGKATVLLLRLLVDAGRPVSVDALVEALWPADPPRDARAALQVKISQLRGSLEPALARPADSTVIISRGDAYVLPTGAGHMIDAERFAALAAQGRRAASERRSADAISDFTEALGLWSGEWPVAESDALWALAERERLWELHRQLVEERAELCLSTGGSLEGVVLDLGALCAEEPLRERSHELLIRALYRSGRQADALTTYAALRARLVDELGVDPTPPIQELHRRVLAQDPQLDAASRPPTSLLPVPLTGFVDAGDRIHRTMSLLRAARVVTLTGPGGTGKTRLALETARTSATDGPVWFVDLTVVQRDDAVGETVATTIGATPPMPDPLAPPQVLEGAVARISRRLDGHGGLLVLDNCEHVLAGAAAFVAAVLAACEDLRVLATSRQALGVLGEAVWSIPPLGVPPPGTAAPDVLDFPAIALLVDRLGTSAPGAVVAQDADLLVEIARRLDGIPLALELVAARARTLSLAAIVRRLDDRLRFLTGSNGLPERHRTLAAVVDWSWRLLDERQRVAASTCAVFHDAFDIDDVVAVDPTLGDRWQVEEVLLDLAERSVLTLGAAGPDGEPTFGMLATVREFAHERLRARDDASRIQNALTTRCIDLVAEAQSELRGPNRPAVLTSFDRRAADLIAALERATAAGDRTAALTLAVGLGWWWIHGRREEGTHYLVAAIGCAGSADPVLEAEAHRWAAFVGQGILPWQEIVRIAEHALAGYVELGHELGSALTLLILAAGEWHTGDPDRARTYAGEAAEAFDQLGDRWGLATATVIAVDLDLEDGQARGDRMATVPDRLDRAGVLFEELGDGWGRMHVHSRRAAYLEQAGRVGDAAEERRSARIEAGRLNLDVAQV